MLSCVHRGVLEPNLTFTRGLFSKIVNGYEPLTIFAKMLPCRHLTGF